MRASSIHVIHCMLVLVTILGYFYFLILVSARADRAEHTAHMIGVLDRLLWQPEFWLSIVLALWLSFFPGSMRTLLKNHLHPSDHQIFKVIAHFCCQLFT